MKTIVITGASDGIGAAAARQLHADGNRVILIGRSPQKTKAIADELGVKYYLADFAKLSDVRKLAVDLRRDVKHIDVLANNAGGVFGDRQETVDGHEKTFQVNYLAPFLLTNLLLDILISSKATVVNTSSVANKILSKFDINDLEGKSKYTAQSAYGNAKLENILFTKELHNRYHKAGLSTAAFHPGIVATSFAKDSKSRLGLIYNTFLGKLILVSPEKGADTLVWLASTQPGKDWQSGGYYVKRKPSKRVDHAAGDPAIAKQLWDWSVKTTAHSDA